MFWIVAFSLTVAGAVAHLLIGDSGVTVERAGRVGLLWLSVVFYGAATFLSGLQHVVGTGVAGLLGLWFGLPYVVGPCVAGAIFYLAAAVGHARDMAKGQPTSRHRRASFLHRHSGRYCHCSGHLHGAPMEDSGMTCASSLASLSFGLTTPDQATCLRAAAARVKVGALLDDKRVTEQTYT